MSSGRIGLPDVYRDEDDPRFFAPHGNCLICKRPLGIPSDPDSLDCGGDCWGCIREIEDIEGIMEDHETFEVAERYTRPESPYVPCAKGHDVEILAGQSCPLCALDIPDDPNADLVGLVIPNVGTVTGTCAWSDGQYVRVITEGERDTCRVAAHVRALRG